jgi:hypothetical protein
VNLWRPCSYCKPLQMLLASQSEGNCSGSAGVRVRLRRLDRESGVLSRRWSRNMFSIASRDGGPMESASLIL